MIKLLITHAIWDMCITQFFQSLTNNFPVTDFTKLDIKLGDHLDIKINLGNKEINFIGCRVESIEGDVVHLLYQMEGAYITIVVNNGVVTYIRGDYNSIVKKMI
jgi:hypothetical protein